MKLKDKMIKRLTNFGKKHRILVYPTLALIAVISAVSNAIYWGKGNGKKLVASAMVIAMLITQSLFLTSSADAENPGGNDSPTPLNTATNINYYLVDDQGTAVLKSSEAVEVTGDAENGYDTKEAVAIPDTDKLATIAFGSASQKTYFSFTTPYYLDNSVETNLPGTVMHVSDINAGIDVYFKATRISYPAVIKDYNDTGADLPITISVATENQVEGKVNPTAEYIVDTAAGYGAYKWGYNFNGIKYDKGDGNGLGGYVVGSTISIAPTGYVDSITFESGWTPMEFTVDYVAVDDGSVNWPASLVFPSKVELNDGANNVVTSSSITYGNDAVSLYTNANIWAGNEAYVLTGWYDPINNKSYSVSEVASNLTTKVNPDDIKEYAPGKTSNIKGVTLYAVWAYKDIKITVDGDAISVHQNGNDVNIATTYGDSIDCTISAKYLTDENGTKFNYVLEDANGTTAQALLQSYGLNGTPVYGDDNVTVTGYRIYGTPTKVTEGATTITIPLTITDDNKPGTSTTHNVNIDIAKREVSIDPASIKSGTDPTAKPNKPYNGTTSIDVANTAEVKPNTDAESGKLTGDSVYVSIGESNATLDTKDAGDNKTITLHSVTLAGDKAGMYKLKGVDANGDLKVENVARVSRQAIQIEIERIDGLTTPVLFGQKTPEYRIKIVDPTVLAGDASTPGSDEELYLNITTDAQRQAFMENILGFTGWETTRKLYSPEGDYSIAPKFKNDDKNYTVESTGSSASFTVDRAEATIGSDYTYSNVKADNDFYPGLVIKPAGNYDLIRALSDDDADMSDSMTDQDISKALGQFKTEYDVPNCTDKDIRFQLLDTETGSITYLVLDNVSVDKTAPVYVSHKISADVENKVHSLGFGTYYHTQDGLNEVEITFVYDAQFSDCSKLYYYFIPEGTTTPGAEFSVDMEKIAGTNNYKGTAKIYLGNAGQLIVYAKNSTGASSAKKRIKIDSADNITADMDYYEWMIENTKMDAHDITVTDIDGNEITSTTKWYNGIKFSVPAEDDDSGVWKVEWIIKDEDGNLVDADSAETETVEHLAAATTTYGKVTSYTFKNSLTNSNVPAGKYTVAAKIYDNAGNVTDIKETKAILVDCKPPVIESTTVPPTSSYQSNVVFEFTATEGDDESGLDTVQVYNMSGSDPNGVLINTWGPQDKYSLSITKNGKYKVVATDKAGNVATLTKEFTDISDQIPDMPIISVTGTLGNNGWYYKDPVTVHISTTTATSDGVPVDTGYKVVFEDHDSTGIVPKQQANDYQIPITRDGQVTIEAWATSEANLTSEIAKQLLKVDTSAPVVIIEESTVDADGIININFKVIDEGSGVDKVKINGIDADVDIVDGVAKGTFKVLEDKEYLISAVDVAGNESGDKGFEPLVLKASPVLDITSNSAYIEADVIKGTYVIDDCYIAYKKHSDTTYTTALITKDDTVPYGIHMDAALRKLDPETVYDYKIYAVTKTSKEVRTIEGSFKTGSNNSMTSIRGTAVYDENLVPEYDRYPIYVSLYEGNTYVAGYKLEGPTDTAYEFNKVSDGTYRIVATDGLLTKTKRVVVANGAIMEPTNYLSANGVNFVLNGMSTSVVVEDNSINIAPDGLDGIFETSTYYEGVITASDKQEIAAGGSVNVTLYAKYISEDDLTAEEANLFNKNLAEDEHIKKYISLYIVKTVRDVNGMLVEEPTLIPMLYDDISISFPLGELSGQTVYVASTHKEQSGGYTFKKWANSSEAILTNKTVTINTNLFSTYVLYIKDAPPKQYVVKWVDGDGKVIKSELVTEGKQATPPTDVPKKTSTSKYTYTFAGWNTKYDKVEKDLVIAALFRANEIKPSSNDKAPDATVKPGDNKPGNTDDISKDKNSVTYMGTSPKTGDATPIMMLAILMIVSVTGIVVLRKKLHNEE